MNSVPGGIGSFDDSAFGRGIVCFGFAQDGSFHRGAVAASVRAAAARQEDADRERARS